MSRSLKNDERLVARHPDRSQAESKYRAELPDSSTARFLDFARNDRWRSFIIRSQRRPQLADFKGRLDLQIRHRRISESATGRIRRGEFADLACLQRRDR